MSLVWICFHLNNWNTSDKFCILLPGDNTEKRALNHSYYPKYVKYLPLCSVSGQTSCHGVFGLCCGTIRNAERDVHLWILTVCNISDWFNLQIPNIYLCLLLGILYSPPFWATETLNPMEKSNCSKIKAVQKPFSTVNSYYFTPNAVYRGEKVHFKDY